MKTGLKKYNFRNLCHREHETFFVNFQRSDLSSEWNWKIWRLGLAKLGLEKKKEKELIIYWLQLLTVRLPLQSATRLH